METATCCCRSTRTARSRGRASISARSASRCTRWTMSPGCCFCGPRRARWSATGCDASESALAHSEIHPLAGLLDVHFVQRGAQPLRQLEGVVVRPVMHEEEVRAVGQHMAVEGRDGDAVFA